MKTIKRFLALLLFFVAAMNVQTLSAQTNGDVNNDGTVNEADISAIIEIMKEANGVGPKKYYWYVGKDNPTNMTSISPIVDDMTSTGWREIGTSIPTYSASNKLFDDSSNSISLGGRVEWYVAIPTKSSAIVRDGLGNDGTQVAICVKQSNVTINGVEYKVFKSDGTERSFSYPIY